ncbi:PREDICTED: uncharacterized protein LOC109332794 isoform X3 [Lupinus angustifolius]|uniref:uncharacterized protein LOC109332794 isoform X3 n=1 Tax=Lupinus angustifolius TaxID=3871 RepID=UPI00092E6929|nr:PREDICTED: uncharacterized protein LOC109332794 isoform X3 [Lupinus angustifolius]
MKELGRKKTFKEVLENISDAAHIHNNQDPLHEVKRRRDRKKELHLQDVGHEISGDAQRHTENDGQGNKISAPSRHSGRRINHPRVSREFRVVRDNRVRHTKCEEGKSPSLPGSTPTSEQLNVNTTEKGSSEASSNQRSCGAMNLSQAFNGSDSHARCLKDTDTSDRKATSEEKQDLILNTAAQMLPIKPNNVHQHSITMASTSSSSAAVYSSSADPIHVPPADSRSSGVVGANRREVGVVGFRRQSSDNLVKQSSVHSSSYANNSLIGKDVTSSNSYQSFGAISKTGQFYEANATVPESINNQYNSRPHQQLMRLQRVPQPNKEWRPKSTQQSSGNSPGVTGTPKKAPSPPVEISKDIKSDAESLIEKLSQINIYENQNVTIAQDTQVAETEYCRLTFGTIGVELESLKHRSQLQSIVTAEKSHEESNASLTLPGPELSSNDDVSGSKLTELHGDLVRSARTNSPSLGVASEQKLPDIIESSSSHNPDSYADVGLTHDSRSSYAHSESKRLYDFHNLLGFWAYGRTTGCEPHLRPTIEDIVRWKGGLLSRQEFLSPTFFPSVTMPGYTSNPPYYHPANGNNHMTMPGGSSHSNANGLKYGVQQFKPVPFGGPTGFHNFTNFTNPNLQADTSKTWIQNPMELGMQSNHPSYNVPAPQTPHAARIPSLNANASSFNAATAAAATSAQSSHMQFHHVPHHLGPSVANSIGVEAAPGSQIGAYQTHQPQMGHQNWTTFF